MVLQRVDELTSPPVVGQHYLVWVVNGVWVGGKRKWYPVMGDKHEDSKFFDFHKQHYHLDRRFVLECSLRGSTYTPLHDFPAQYEMAPVFLSKPELARRKCQRAMSEFPAHHKQVQAMQSHLAGAQCQRHETGWVCPHRGFRLGSIEPERGIIRCPLHGLQIDAESGTVI